MKAVRFEDGLRYVVTLQQRPNRFLSAWVREVPLVTRAWPRLTQRARTEAGAVVPHLGEILEVPLFVRDIGVDASTVER